MTKMWVTGNESPRGLGLEKLGIPLNKRVKMHYKFTPPGNPPSGTFLAPYNPDQAEQIVE
jgi:hypothetical protein